MAMDGPGVPAQHSQPWMAAPGPVDRVHFFDEQRRHRRSTWRLSMICGLGVLIMGLPTSVVVTPAVYAVIILATWIAGMFVPIPESVWDRYRDFALLLFSSLDEIDRPEGDPNYRLLAFTGLAMLLPGAFALVGLWLLVRARLTKSGIGGILLSIGAREPRRDDLEEQQLVNVVHEMAIAAGLTPPRVQLLDSLAPNAAVIGASTDDYTVVVSRRLLDDLDRDQTQAVLGHLIGSAGNGDLRIGLTIIAIFETIGIALAGIDALGLSKSGWNTTTRAAKFLMGRSSTVEAEAVSELITRSLLEPRNDDVLTIATDERLKAGPGILPFMIRTRVLIPLLVPSFLAGLVGLFLRMGLLFTMGFVVSPLVALTWRTRRYLADASAVQLTRNPDAVAGGLLSLAQRGGDIPGGEWASTLFIVGHGASTAASQAESQQQALQYAEALKLSITSDGSGPEAIAARERLRAIRAQQRAPRKSLDSTLLSSVSFHPPLWKRLKRLRAMGATSVAEPVGQGWLAQMGRAIIAAPIIAPLLALAGLLLIPLAVLVTALIGGFMFFVMAVSIALLYALISLLR